MLPRRTRVVFDSNLLWTLIYLYQDILADEAVPKNARIVLRSVSCLNDQGTPVRARVGEVCDTQYATRIADPGIRNTQCASQPSDS
jgi:uncharacterized protein (UPF0147 family)